MNDNVENPLVTAIVTTYNRPQMVQRAIRSVLAQTYKPLEIILAEEGSDSSVEALLKDEGLSHIRYFSHDENKGLAAARNIGLREARGKYVAYLDDDDEWLPEKLEKQVRLAETRMKSCAVVYCGALVVSSAMELLGKNRPRLRGDIRTEIKEKGLSTIPSSCLFRREALVKVGGFDEDLISHIDHDIWLQLAREEYAADCIDECLVRAYEHQRPRMTTNIQSRLRATEVFFKKWQPEFENWFGKEEGRIISLHYFARIMAGLGFKCVEGGKSWQGAKCFFSAICHHPTQLGYYAGMVAAVVGVRAYSLLIRLRKYLKLRKARNE